MKHLQNFREYLNESIEEEEDRKRSSNWSFEYLTISYYFYKFGLDNLIREYGEETFSNEQELCDLMKVKQLNMYGRNFVNLEDDRPTDAGLSHTGINLEKVYFEYSGHTEPKLRDVVISILDLIIFKKWDNDNFNGIAKTIKLAEKEKTKAEIKAENLKLKFELETIIKDYIFEEGEIVTLHTKGSSDDLFEIKIIESGKNPYFNRLDRNIGVKFGPFQRKLYDIIYPHKLDSKYFNIKIDLH
jgi:hypothetical protein